MEQVPAEWFSVQTVREWGAFMAVGAAVGAYGLAFAIRHKWISLSANMETSLELAEAKKDIEYKDIEIARLTDENESLKQQLDEATSGDTG